MCESPITIREQRDLERVCNIQNLLPGVPGVRFQVCMSPSNPSLLQLFAYQFYLNEYCFGVWEGRSAFRIGEVCTLGKIREKLRDAWESRLLVSACERGHTKPRQRGGILI